RRICANTASTPARRDICFVATCGIKSFFVPRSHPDGIDINLCCLDVDSVPEYTLQAFRDAEREASTAALAHLSVPGPH
ncbi:glutathione-dependent formaldehyde-activating, partial [mine drainage metagenome]